MDPQSEVELLLHLQLVHLPVEPLCRMCKVLPPPYTVEVSRILVARQQSSLYVVAASWFTEIHEILLVHGRPMPCVQKRPILESKASSSRQFHVLSQNVPPSLFYIIIILNIVCSSCQV